MAQIPASSTIWFTSVLKAVRTADGSAIVSPLRIDVHQSRITLGSWPHVITMPESTVVLDPSISVPGRMWTGRRTKRRLFAVSGFEGGAVQCSAVRGAGAIHSAFQRPHNASGALRDFPFLERRLWSSYVGRFATKVSISRRTSSLFDT